MVIFENQLLNNEVVFLPEPLVVDLRKVLATHASHTESDGYKRLKHLLDQNYNDKGERQVQKRPSVTFRELKRIKNFFDTFGGKEDDPEYILNGGTEMKNWVNQTLNSMRNSVSGQLKNMKNQTRMQNHDLKGNSVAKPIKVDDSPAEIYVREAKTVIFTEAQAERLKELIS